MADDKRELLHNEESPEPKPEVSNSATPSSNAPPEYTPGPLQDGLNLQNPPGYRDCYPGHVQHHQARQQEVYQYQYPAQFAGPGQPNFVPRPGQGIPTNGAPTQVVVIRHAQSSPPQDYLVMAILVTLFCCIPFGIVGIVKAIEAKDQYMAGNYQAATKASQSAGQWSKAGLISGCVFACISIALAVTWVFILV